jgi:hypothetical protein
MKVDNVKVFFKYEENGTTVAIAKNVETNEELASREVRLRHGDKPEKIVGRKYAFKKLMTHVMNNNIFPKPIVGELWKQFGSQCKQPKQKLAY